MIPAPSPYAEVAVLRLSRVRPDGRWAVRFTEALRRAVMARVADPLPAVLHGHGAQDRPHVAFLALPAVGSAGDDGRLLGLAVALPPIAVAERDRIVAGVLGTGAFALRVPSFGVVELRHEPGWVRPPAVDPLRWQRGSRCWVSATPMVLDRYPKPKPGAVEAEVVRGLRTAGLPEPEWLRVSMAPLQPGGVRLAAGELPEQARGRLFRHVAVGFPEVVTGPVLAGAGRYLGVGLFTPTPEPGPYDTVG
ncbi:MAG: type I-U CRISPR-associated protein Cas5/Cas6 [Actinobacteria bacterium]|nr:type I-U CRISPR-associated protein Cas5/Cas6 [Actinomycetota bacterium]MBI3689021.1 type I-U CRISPR-associated protein Cas5/Cas6 [Actinomycetota bacterium]